MFNRAAQTRQTARAEDFLDVDQPRLAVLRAILEGASTWPELERRATLPKGERLAGDRLEETLRKALALGLVEFHGETVALTGLGERVAKLSL